MNLSPSSSRRFILTAGIAALLGGGLAQPPRASAIDIFKDNNLDPLNSITSWQGGGVPGPNDVGVWDATVAGANSVLLGGDLNWMGLRLANPGGAVIIAGANTLTLGASGIDLSASTQSLTLNMSSLFVSGPVGLGTTLLTVGATNAIFSGVISGTAAASTTALAIGPSSTVRLLGANTFTGQATIGTGSLVTAANNAALGAAGVGNETIVTGGTLDVGGANLGTELVRIQGTGAGGAGALMNSGISQINALQTVALTGDAAVNAVGAFAITPGTGTATASGRFDIRAAAYTAAAMNLDLGGFTLTKTGGQQFSLVNADVTAGNIIVNAGLLSIEADTRMANGGANTITVNAGGRLGFFALAATAAVLPITVAGGSLGETGSSTAVQTLNAPVTFTTSSPELWATSANGPILAGVVSGTAGGALTEVVKRGAGTITLNNAGNTFDLPMRVAQGILRADFTTALAAGGVPPAGALTTTDTPLGTAGTITLSGGTLAVRINMANDNTNQQFDLQRAITVDRAPSAMTFDRLSNAAQIDKILVVPSLTFAPSSAANGYAIGQNQFTFTQANTHRLQVSTMTLNNDTVISAGDVTYENVLSAGRHSLVRTGGSTQQFVTPSTQEFNAFFNLGTGSVRVGTGFGTPTTSPTVTIGDGPIYLAPGSGITFRTPTNIGATQTLELFGNRVAQAALNLELFTSVPAGLRALGSGVLALGNATAFGNLDLSVLGDGTFRVGSNISSAGSGTITGVIKAGAGNVVRVGAAGTLTVSGANRVTGTATLDVGSPLINGGFATQVNAAAQNGTVILTGANDHTGGTMVNRGSTLRFENNGSLGTGTVNVFGTLTAQQAGGVLTLDGLTNTLTPNLFGGGGLSLDNGALTGTTDTNRWGDNVPISLTAGTLTLNSRNDNTSTTSETVGALSFAGGSTVQLNRQNAVAGNNTQLIASGLTRTGSGTLEINRSTGTGAGFGTAQFFKISGTAPVVTNGMVQPFMTLVDGTRLQNFATYNAGNGFVNATYTNTVTTAAFPTGLNAGTQIVYVDFATGVLTSTLGDNPVIYALKVGAGAAAASATTLANGVGSSITLRGGGLIVSGDTTAGNFSVAGGTQTTINPALVFNNGAATIEGIINVRTGTAAILNGLITANGLTKFGAGTLNLTANQTTLTGVVSVNQGILQLSGPTATTNPYNPAGTNSVQLAGGQLNLRSNNSAVTGTINTTMQMGLTVAAGIPIATLDVNRSGADTASSGTFLFQPATAGSPGLQLLGAPGPQGQTFTLSGANYNVTFQTNAINTSTGNVTYNITGARTLQLDDGTEIFGTAPVITKSGDGTLIYARASGTASVPAGTRVVINAGALEPRSILSFGSVASTTIELNGGQLNLRRDSTAVWSGNTIGSGTGYPVIVNGNSAITAGPVGAVTNFRLAVGALTINGNPTLTASSTGGYAAEFQSARLNGLPFFSSSIAAGNTDSALRISGAITGGGFVKTNTGHLHLLGTNNTYDGGTWISQGILRVRAVGALGTGTVTLNPGATIDFNSSNNLNFGQALIVRGNSNFLPMISMNTDLQHPITDVDTSAAPIGVIGLSNTTAGFYSTPIDLGTLYGGGWYLGGLSTGAYDARYTADTLGVGAGNTYRLGGGGLAFVAGADNFNNPINNVLTGAGAKVVYGFDSGNLRGANTTTFQFVIGGTQDYGGATTINRGTVTRIVSANDGTFSGLSSSAVNVFGNLAIGTDASLATGAGGTTNIVTLHPGAALHLDNNNTGGQFAAVNLADRWGDTTPIALNGALLDLVGNNNIVTTETVGEVSYSRGARIRVGLVGTGTATLNIAALSAAGGTGHTLTLQSSGAATLGSPTGDRLIVAGTAPAVTNGMVSPHIVNATANTFVTYGTTDGFTNVTYDATVAGNNTTPVALPTGLAATTKLDVNTGTVVLADNPTVYALRTNQSINIAGANSTVTLRSGGLIGSTNTLTLQPNLVFNDGNANIEARIYNSSTVNINGSLTANGITKFGAGNLSINVPQPDYASGWTVNAGTLQINNLQGLGQSVPGNAVTLNATQTTTGSAAQAQGITNLTFNRDTGSPELAVFTGGPITVVNEATIRANGTTDRNFQIPDVTLTSTGTSSVGFTFDVPQNRSRVTIPTLTLANDATIRVLDSGATTDTGRVTAGVINSLVGTGVQLNKIGNRTLELASDNSATFTGGSIVVSQGTVRVLHNGSLGSAATTATIERNATLEIGVGNFASVASLTQLPGSIERWNVENARPAAYDLPVGVNLQLNTNLLGAHVIGLNGGSLEGFLWIDQPAAADQRTIGSSVNINLLADSFVGQNVLLGQGYDLGRQPTVAQPFGNALTGSQLVINGSISGSFNLTKTGLDTVVLAGAINTYNNTSVDMGVLRIGANGALPASGALTTRFAGVFDLFGFNQTVAGLGTDNAGLSPGGVSLGSSGRVLNSAPTDNTLTVENTTDFTYNGTIERTVALTKKGGGILTITATNTYTGLTTVSAGTLALSNGAAIIDTGAVVIDNVAGATLLLNDSETIGSLSGGGATGGEVALNDKTLTVGDSTPETTFSGTISGTPGVLIKRGTGTFTIDGVQTYGTLTTNAGTTNVNSEVGTGGSTVNANATTNFGHSQTLAALNIGANAIVTLAAPPPPALFVPDDALGAAAGFDGGEVAVTPIQAVPEPGAGALLFGGLAMLLGLRRRK